MSALSDLVYGKVHPANEMEMDEQFSMILDKKIPVYMNLKR